MGAMRSIGFRAALAAGAALAWTVGGASAATIDEVVSAIVKVTVHVPGDARSARTLGTERVGAGTLIAGDGLVVTIGYLILEADRVELTTHDGKKMQAEVVAYDYDSGFGLLRAAGRLAGKPLKLGESAELKPKDRVLAVTHGGVDAARPAVVAARRTFAGYWEYLLENAIFTMPPIDDWGGAALVSADGKLVGVGSLVVGDAIGENTPSPGNMFVPIDALKPIMADMLTQGRPSAPSKPWLGLNSEEVRGRLFVTRVQPDTPAAKAGLKPGDIVLGVSGQPVATLAELYRRIWATGPAGVDVKLNVIQGALPQEITVKSADRYKFLKMNRTY